MLELYLEDDLKGHPKITRSLGGRTWMRTQQKT
jgi:hypothetical protein